MITINCDNLTEKCMLGYHNFIPVWIDNTTTPTTIIEWCKNCGSIVFNGSLDGRIYPEYYGKIKCPELLHEICSENNSTK